MTRLARAGRRMLRALARPIAAFSMRRRKRIVITEETAPESLLRDIGLLDGRGRRGGTGSRDRF
ncbi:hypothetical protein [Jiella avicenniae]|uniref:DUF1127 domain-containing protein n=1 Tax=Jiella avicenniae TaxID=2907202 RepID=A0A9X1T2L8_9HYPH|nr:hypothetical protein [Jiella avicenniae]MCE7026381.1 hypothetical protein [Jiella avicenniae]